MFKRKILGLIASLLVACNLVAQTTPLHKHHPEGMKVQSRFDCPDTYHRIQKPADSYASFLQNLPLKPSGSLVHNFDGSVNSKQNVYCAVIAIDVGTRDLQQCADAVMRLRAEYLYSQKRFNEIHFNFLSDGQPRYLTKYCQDPTSYDCFRRYLNYVYAFANTASLKNELHAKSIDQMEIGDVLIQSGSPFGHAVTVLDMCENNNGDQVFMLGQSYMPAQEIQVLLNPKTKESPWYPLKSGEIQTPEWTFRSLDLRSFTK